MLISNKIKRHSDLVLLTFQLYILNFLGKTLCSKAWNKFQKYIVYQYNRKLKYNRGSCEIHCIYYINSEINWKTKFKQKNYQVLQNVHSKTLRKLHINNTGQPIILLALQQNCEIFEIISFPRKCNCPIVYFTGFSINTVEESEYN